MSVDHQAPHTIEVGIPMRDGVELAADVHLPAAQALPAPAIVVGSPYDKSGPVDDIRPFRDAGYVAITYDVRGRGKSEGEWNPFSSRDALDGHDAVEWVAAQDWCTGDIGVTGLSYSAWVAWATMSQRPPHLRAAVPISPVGRYMEEIPYTHGCFQLYFAYWFAFVRRRIMDHGLDIGTLVNMLPVGAIGDAIDVAGPAWREWMEHDTLDDYWRERRWDGAYDFGVPCLHVTGWHDREDIHGAFHHYEQVMASSPARDRQWLLVGPWSHASCRFTDDSYMGVDAPDSALDMDAISLRFFDRFVRGEDNGVDGEPRVRLYDPGRRRWEVRPSWKAGTREHELFLDAEGALSGEPGSDGHDAYRYDPLDPAGATMDVNGFPWEPQLDLRELEARPDVLVWSTPRLTEDVTVHGWGELALWAATDGEDTEWHVKVSDVEPDGRSLCVAWGCLRASYGRDAAAPAPVSPGEIVRYAIELTPAFHTFQQGHRIRVVLASSDFPWFARNLNRFEPIATQDDPRTATNTVHRGGAHPSRLRLSVEDER